VKDRRHKIAGLRVRKGVSSFTRIVNGLTHRLLPTSSFFLTYSESFASGRSHPLLKFLTQQPFRPDQKHENNDKEGQGILKSY
jgi:hypothetical protein